MTVRSTMKSYCKVIQCAFDTSASVSFNDSLGTAIDCNYFKVDAHVLDGSGIGYFLAQPSGIYSNQTSTLEMIGSASGTTHHTTSGIGGVMGSAGDTVEMSLNSTEKTAGILLWNKLEQSTGAGSSAATFIVTYGNMKQANPKRDQDGAFYPTGR